MLGSNSPTPAMTMTGAMEADRIRISFRDGKRPADLASWAVNSSRTCRDYCNVCWGHTGSVSRFGRAIEVGREGGEFLPQMVLAARRTLQFGHIRGAADQLLKLASAILAKVQTVNRYSFCSIIRAQMRSITPAFRRWGR